jgi:hypothetical protein
MTTSISLTDKRNEFNSEIGRLGLAASYKKNCLGILQKTVLWISTGFNEDTDPAFYLNSDPDPDPGIETNADPDPVQTLPSQKV